MEPLKAIIVDDEEFGRKNLEQLILDYCPSVSVIGMAGSSAEALQILYKHPPDLLFLDIQMPGGSGFDILSGFQAPDFATIFVTAYRDFGIEALKAGAIDYILKPVDFRELREAVAKVHQRVETSYPPPGTSRILVHQAEGSFILHTRDLLYIKAHNNYSEFFLANGQSKVISMNLGKVETTYQLEGFFRINNSLIINLYHAISYTKVGGKSVILSSGESFPISRRRYFEFTQAILQYVD